uniref:CPSF_A domain-containing protein n=1 Tax=Globodera pallida TaxID=36090 RepID=A0A183BZ89_GLOPA
MHFRDTALSFKVSEDKEEVKRSSNYDYPNMTYEVGVKQQFQLNICRGEFTDSNCGAAWRKRDGQNDVYMVRGRARILRDMKPTSSDTEVLELSISYKPQKIAPKFEGTGEGEGECIVSQAIGTYGVVTMPSINQFLDGFIPSENMRFRDTTTHRYRANSFKSVAHATPWLRVWPGRHQRNRQVQGAEYSVQSSEAEPGQF